MNNDKIISDIKHKFKEQVLDVRKLKKDKTILIDTYSWKQMEEAISLTLQEAQKQSAEEIKKLNLWINDNVEEMKNQNFKILELEQQISDVNKIIDKLLTTRTEKVVNGNLPKQRIKDYQEGYNSAYDVWLNKIKELKSSLSKGDVHTCQEENLSEEEITKDKSGWTNPADTPLGQDDKGSSAPKDNDICKRVNSIGFKGQCRKCISCGDVKIWDYPNIRKCPNGKNHKWRPVSSDSLNEEENKSIKEQIELDKKVKHKVINFVASKDERSEE